MAEQLGQFPKWCRNVFREMLEHFPFGIRLRLLQKEKCGIAKYYDASFKDARVNNDREKEQEVASLIMYETDCVDDKIAVLQSQYLSTMADRYLVPAPEMNEAGAWVESDISGKWHLSPDAIMTLRTQIYEERKRRRENWMPWVAMTIGLISAATGLIAALTAWYKD